MSDKENEKCNNFDEWRGKVVDADGNFLYME